MKPRQVVFTEKGKAACEPIEIPRPKAGQVLIENRCSLISTGTETTVLYGKYAPGTHWDDWVKYPFHPGYSSCGVVTDVGEGVTTYKPGDRVAGNFPHASHVVKPVERVHKVPDNVSDSDAAWIHLGKIVQVGTRAAEHVLGDSVVVIGLGILGQLAIQYARASGAEQVIAIDTAPRRLEFARAHGAAIVLNMTADKAVDSVKKATHGLLADVVYDVTGHPAVLATALPLARKFGKVVLLGDPGKPTAQHITADVISRGVKIVGAHDTHPHELPHDLVRWSAMQMEKLFLHYLSTGQIRVADLVSHRSKPEDAQKMYDVLERDRASVMGAVFDWK